MKKPSGLAMPIPKVLDNTIKFIEELESDASIQNIKLDGVIKPLKALWQKKDRKYILDIDDQENTYDDEYNTKAHYSLEVNLKKVKFAQLFISKRTSDRVIGEITSMQSEEFNHTSKAVNRLMIPIPLNFKPDFTFSIKSTPVVFSLNKKPTITFGIKIKLRLKTFFMYTVFDNPKDPSFNYVIIECEQKLSENRFHEYCYSILLSFGFITGELILNEGYFMQYDHTDMVNPVNFGYTRFRISISCTYVPVYTNPYGWLHDAKLHELYKNKVRHISSKEFSELCKLVYIENDYKSLLLLILETASVSLVSSPAILSVALESLANMMEVENEKAFSVINKTIFSKLRRELTATLITYQGEIGQGGTRYLTNKLNNLNQVTNRDRLLIPFKIMNISLNEMDLYAIDQRNAFLHGSHPMVETPTGIARNKSDSLRYFLFLKLYTLISALILKRIGYDSLIVNYPKIYEKETNVNLNEDHYRDF